MQEASLYLIVRTVGSTPTYIWVIHFRFTPPPSDRPIGILQARVGYQELVKQVHGPVASMAGSFWGHSAATIHCRFKNTKLAVKLDILCMVQPWGRKFMERIWGVKLSSDASRSRVGGRSHMPGSLSWSPLDTIVAALSGFKIVPLRGEKVKLLCDGRKWECSPRRFPAPCLGRSGMVFWSKLLADVPSKGGPQFLLSVLVVDDRVEVSGQ